LIYEIILQRWFN